MTPNIRLYDASIGGAWFDTNLSQIFAGCYDCYDVWFHIELCSTWVDRPTLLWTLTHQRDTIRLFCLTFTSHKKQPTPIMAPLHLEDPFANLCKRHRKGEIYRAISLSTTNSQDLLNINAQLNDAITRKTGLRWGSELRKSPGLQEKSVFLFSPLADKETKTFIKCPKRTNNDSYYQKNNIPKRQYILRLYFMSWISLLCSGAYGIFLNLWRITVPCKVITSI